MKLKDMKAKEEFGSRASAHSDESDDELAAGVRKKPIDLDDVLVKEAGQCGRYQLRSLALMALPIFTSAWFNDFVFTGAALPHRCRIPECGEDTKDFPFQPEWLAHAIPQMAQGAAGCERYAPLGSGGSPSHCPPQMFNHSALQSCDGHLVYARNNSLVYDFDLGCHEWLRSVSGTVMNCGALLALPVAGFLSDRFGRRVLLIYSLFNTGLIGVIRAVSTNYTMFLVLQFFWAFLGTGTYSAAYIFGAELMGPKYRVVASATCSSMFAVGQALMGALAWLVQPWRYLMLTLAIPSFFLISYYWILDESVRWLISKKKHEEAEKVLRRVAVTNNKRISEKSMSGLLATPETVRSHVSNRSGGLFLSTVRSPILLRRVCTTPVWWVATTFVYYGLSINAVSFSDTMYLNYILVCIIEIPGYFAAVFLLARIGRKPTLFFGYLLSAVCNFTFPFLANGSLRLTLYLVAKFSISVVFTSVYLFTAELYPTEFRHSFVSFSSMVGRVGAILAPLTPALMVYWHGIPSMLFGGLATVAATLVLTQPETLGCKLPDTLAEAQALGTPSSKLRT